MHTETHPFLPSARLVSGWRNFKTWWRRSSPTKWLPWKRRNTQLGRFWPRRDAAWLWAWGYLLGWQSLRSSHGHWGTPVAVGSHWWQRNFRISRRKWLSRPSFSLSFTSSSTTSSNYRYVHQESFQASLVMSQATIFYTIYVSTMLDCFHMFSPI